MTSLDTHHVVLLLSSCMWKHQCTSWTCTQGLGQLECTIQGAHAVAGGTMCPLYMCNKPEPIMLIVIPIYFYAIIYYSDILLYCVSDNDIHIYSSFST